MRAPISCASRRPSGPPPGVLDAVVLAAPLRSPPAAETRPIDPPRSSLPVRVFRSGVSAAFADNHGIHAPIAAGEVAAARPEAALAVDARRMTVLDPDLS